jgi:hypothetical protein
MLPLLQHLRKRSQWLYKTFGGSSRGKLDPGLTLGRR